jgi:hypothetical protein
MLPCFSALGMKRRMPRASKSALVVSSVFRYTTSSSMTAKKFSSQYTPTAPNMRFGRKPRRPESCSST